MDSTESRASSRSGGFCPSQRKQASPVVTIAAIGWFTSWTIEAASSPSVATRVAWASSACLVQCLFGTLALGDVVVGLQDRNRPPLPIPLQRPAARHDELPPGPARVDELTFPATGSQQLCGDFAAGKTVRMSWWETWPMASSLAQPYISAAALFQ
jgi:hypothetical protein